MTTETILWLLVILVGILSFTLIFGLIGLNRKIEQNQDLNPLHTKVDLIFKQNRDVIEKFTEKNGDLKIYLSNVMATHNQKTTEDFIQFSDKMKQSLEVQIDRINQRVDEKLGTGFEQTNKTFNEVVERLTRIDAAQKQIEQLSNDVVSLNEILSDKKNRGTFGEIQLKQIFVSIFGENSSGIYELQKTLSNGTVVDSILHAPDPMGDICIDSKFPLENYRRMIDRELRETERKESEKTFKSDVKKHIDNIVDKYIIPGETADQAIMFIPAEAIFAEINARHEDLFMYAQSKRVWFASPTTLMSTLTVVQMILKDIQRNKYSKVIQEELNKLGIEFERYQDRFDKLLKNISTVSKQADQVSKTTDKITKRFKVISNVDTDQLIEPEADLMLDIDEIETIEQ
jgi:DNA recombination protein RmuC